MKSSTLRSDWDECTTTDKQNKSKTNHDNDEAERGRDRCRRLKTAFSNSNCCCCPCSAPILAGILIGALTAGIAFAVILSVYLVDSAKTTSLPTIAALTTSVTSTTSTSATSTSSTSSTSTSSTSSTTSTSTTSTTSATTATTTTATTATTSTTTSVTTSTTTTTTTTKPYCTTRITFDDIANQSATSGVVPNGYNNLNWTNTFYLNASTMPLSGYPNAVSSPPFVAYNPGGAMVTIASVNGTSFSFDSVILASAWRDNLIWTINAYRSGINMIGGSFSLSVINQTIITCGSCTNLDTLTFATSGGTPSPGLSQNGTEFGFDDLCISFGY